MEKKYFSRQLLLATDQLILIFYLCTMTALGHETGAESCFHLLLVFFIFGDAAYISYKNIQNNSLINQFTFLMLLSGWQLLLSLFDVGFVSVTLATALLPFNLYQVVYFAQLFVFETSAYRHQKGFLCLLRIACVVSTVCFFVSPVVFAFSYMGQILLSVVAFLFVAAIHYRQMLFFLKSQKKELLFSGFLVVLPVLCYIFAFHNRAAYLDNLGSYLVLMLTFVSIHNIVFRYHPAQERFYTLSGRSKVVLILVGLIPVAAVAFTFHLTYALLLIFGHIAVFLTVVCNILLYLQICRQPENFDNLTDRVHFYAYSLAQIKREEAIKKDFSNYLHDDILQDLLSIRNFIGKTDNPEIRQLLLDTLGKLNASIRMQMQTYHPNLIKSMTLKENLQSLLNTLGEHQNVKLSLDCDDKIFLTDPYPVLVTRMIKELVTNALKHADATKICVLLMQEDGRISLKVADNGVGFPPHMLKSAKHHGLASIREQVSLLSGTFTIRAAPSGGTEAVIVMPMNGGDAYENLIG